MILRSEQMKIFDHQAFMAMRDRLVAHVREHHPESIAHLSPEDLEKEVETGMRRAQGYGLTQETTIGAFVSLRFVTSPNFDEQPAIQAALRDESMPPDARMDTLMERTEPEDWDEAARRRR